MIAVATSRTTKQNGLFCAWFSCIFVGRLEKHGLRGTMATLFMASAGYIRMPLMLLRFVCGGGRW